MTCRGTTSRASQPWQRLVTAVLLLAFVVVLASAVRSAWRAARGVVMEIVELEQ
jgi:hypothetical protein